MSRPIIEVSGLSKRYQLGLIGATRLRDDVERFWHRVTGRAEKEDQSEFWALRDVSFNVPPGEVVGVIGRNGAGKSTLLKILSRITEPTQGRIAMRGRVASLLEVGTGFHGDLTGRENIFLNGAILGMTKAEIRGKFDEIVAFAGIDKFIDTPVKRYSSGMYVRLAFAVAAHLEPEILIVDEVLAVGDTQFQKKCLGKMQEVSRGGRTILFVSHNVGAIRSLCGRCVLLSSGGIVYDGPTEQGLEKYAASSENDLSKAGNIVHRDQNWWNNTDEGNGSSLVFASGTRQICVPCGSALKFEFHVHTTQPLHDVTVAIMLLDRNEEPLVYMDSHPQAVSSGPGPATTFRVHADLGCVPLNAGVYRARVYLCLNGRDTARFSNAAVVEVMEHDVFGSGVVLPAAAIAGPFYWAPKWNIETQNN